MDHQLNLPSPRLPPEICDYILDHLRDDRKTLKVCSRVTREWLSRTRKHIFHFVLIINLRLLAFEDVISHSGDAVALCVRELHLVWNLRNGLCSLPIPASVPRMLASLGRLEKFAFNNSVWDDRSSSAETITWPVLPIVNALYVNICTLNDVVSLQRFICACPSLSSLRLVIRGTSERDSSRTHPPTVISRSIVIETFRCNVCGSDPTLRWLLQGGLKLRIRRLAITNVCDDPLSVDFLRMGDAQGLLRASGECLEHLVVDLAREALSASPAGQQAALAHNPNLVSINVSKVLCCSYNDLPSSTDWPSLLSILADIQPMHTKLQSVDITLCDITTNSKSMPWEQLDGIMARIVDIHPRLVFTIWIISSDHHVKPWLAEFVEALLQGLVRVQAGRGRLCLMWLIGDNEKRESGYPMTPSWSWSHRL
ncbi:uncharacterized protein LAESUDRAFT_811795, partial [Laetiporus sulphureus 93-53]